MEAKKYKLTKNNVNHFGSLGYYRIKALKDFGNVKKGDIGGYVENEDNLSQYGDCWIYDDAKVYGNAKVCDNAKIYERAKIHGNAIICNNAIIESDSDYIVFKNWWSSGRYFTWTRSNNMWNVGCFYGTGEELIEKAYKDSELSGREYKRVVDYVNSIIQEQNIKERLLSKIRKLFGR